jgi:hypothetical protein
MPGAAGDLPRGQAARRKGGPAVKIRAALRRWRAGDP